MRDRTCARRVRGDVFGDVLAVAGGEDADFFANVLDFLLGLTAQSEVRSKLRNHFVADCLPLRGRLL